MRSLILSIALLICVSLSSYSLPVFAKGLVLFSTQDAAQEHCPNDEVVWLNLPTGIWHTQGQRWYGATKKGAYVCEEEARAAGDRASLNG
jgi:hypothetical protein